MKFLDTYESWGQIFKLCRLEGSYIMWIHKHDKSYKIQMEKNELKELATFIENFIDEDYYEKESG